MIETALLERITAKAELDRLRPQAPHGLDNLNRSQDIELTYTSNAIEGNTLTAAETRMVIVLLRGGYPPVAVRPQERPAYIGALQDAQAGRGTEPFDNCCTRDSTQPWTSP